MKYVNRTLKGTYGYIRKQRIFEIIKTAILFAMALGIFYIGYRTLGTKRSLWSVLAVLALLPASRSLVGVIMLMRFPSLTKEQHEKYSVYTADIPTVFENILTTGSRTFYSPVICCMANTLICYADYDRKDADVLKEHIENVIRSSGHSAAVAVFTDEASFERRAGELSSKFSEENGSDRTILETIKAVSL
ncbi:MAG: hypothetical protein K6G58_01780 [Lachnospiraceae bacterium]|nr:hypothetical protein [Lachnospiraceae bacterium]